MNVAGELNGRLRASLRFYSKFTARDVAVTLVHARDQILPGVVPALREFARMDKHDVDWTPVVEDNDTRRLLGMFRSERMLGSLVEHTADR